MFEQLFLFNSVYSWLNEEISLFKDNSDYKIFGLFTLNQALMKFLPLIADSIEHNFDMSLAVLSKTLLLNSAIFK